METRYEMQNSVYRPHTERLAKLHERVVEIAKRLPNDLAYHEGGHTLDPKLGVAAMTNKYALMEEVPDDKREVLVAAAYNHDLGFVERYAKNEPIGARIAGEIMPACGYKPDEVKVAQDLILITDPTKQPTNQLEMIIRDADVDNLGRADFFEKNEAVFRELVARGIISDDKLEWYMNSLKFVTGHQFYTESAKGLRGEQKQRNIDALTERIDSMVSENARNIYEQELRWSHMKERLAEKVE